MHNNFLLQAAIASKSPLGTVQLASYITNQIATNIKYSVLGMHGIASQLQFDGLDANIALGFASCYIRHLSLVPCALFLIQHWRQCFNFYKMCYKRNKPKSLLFGWFLPPSFDDESAQACASLSFFQKWNNDRFVDDHFTQLNTINNSKLNYSYYNNNVLLLDKLITEVLWPVGK